MEVVVTMTFYYVTYILYIWMTIKNENFFPVVSLIYFITDVEMWSNWIEVPLGYIMFGKFLISTR